jgi:hypothetical protein
MAIDGIGGSAFAGFNYCWIQPRMATPKAQWSLDAARPVDFYTDWQRLPETEPYVNAFRRQWELFLRRVAEGAHYSRGICSCRGGKNANGLMFPTSRHKRRQARPVAR